MASDDFHTGPVSIRSSLEIRDFLMIKCVDFKPYQKNTLQGFADLHICKWGVIVHGFALHMKEGRRWITMPSKEYQKEDGTKGYAPIIRFMKKEHFEMFCDQAKQAIDEFCKKEKNKDEISTEI